MKDPPDPPPLSPGVQRLPERSGRESFFPGIKGNVKNRECAGGNRIAPTPHSKGFFRQHGKPGEAEAEPTEFRVHHAGKARTKQLGRGNIPKIRAQKSREFHGMKQRQSPAGARGSGRDRAEFPREGRELRGREFHAWEGPRPGWGLEHPGIGERPCLRIRLDRDGAGMAKHSRIPRFQPIQRGEHSNPSREHSNPSQRAASTWMHPAPGSRIPRLRLGMDHPWSRRCGIVGKGGEFQQDSGFLSWD